MKNVHLVEKLRQWFIEPSPLIEGLDKRRQASLLSALLLTVIIVSSIVELATIVLIEWESYTGYKQTFVALVFLSVVYFISRTQHTKFAARLMVIGSSAAVFITGWFQPNGVNGGLLDFLIFPLWLGSLYLDLRELLILVVLNLFGLLLYPSFSDAVTLNFILVGPFSFIFATSILLFIITRHRNFLENDRQRELAKKEKLSREEADRTITLLRVAGRLNSQLDLDTLLETLSEETARALNTPASIVTLYDPRTATLKPVIGKGLSKKQIEDIPVLTKKEFDEATNKQGTVFSLDNLQHITLPAHLEEFRKYDIRSVAIATMEHEGELIGNLVGVSIGEDRSFKPAELLLLKGIANQAALAIINTRLFKDAQRRFENLQALRAIDTSILSNRNLPETLNILLEKLTSQLGVDAAIALLIDKQKQVLSFAAGRGLDVEPLRNATLPIGEGLAGRAVQEKRIIYIHDLRTDPQALSLKPLSEKEGFISYFAIPLETQVEINGVLEIFHRSHLDLDEEWLGFLEALAGQASIAIGSAILFSDLQRTNEELSEAYDTTIEGWSHALDLRDKETEGHTRRVTELTLELAKAFGFSDEELVHIRRGGLLHDIGKLGVPDRILFKDAALTTEEWALMKRHPIYAHEMLEPIHYLHQALDIPYCHHEKWDGNGYPRGLSGEDIPLSARIFAVVDVWDAVTSDRPYRAAWTADKALAYIKSESGKHFDPRVVEMFTRLMEQKNERTNGQAT
ncbi:MAG: GAF domain-containing protein [Anaerolineales bacterium]|nr:GAF domain-containing protein [Anaerolineales bacterium]